MSLRNLYVAADRIPPVPRYTENRIKQLCSEVVAARTEAETESLITQLRAALDEHISLAKRSLEVQVSTISLLELRSRLGSHKKKKSAH
jgi:hypothetical protein